VPPEIFNKDSNERWRFTLSMGMNGVPTFSVIGIHTLYEVSGVLLAICCELSRRAWTGYNPDLFRELTGNKRS
jgi:hypothetical protein